MPPRHAAHSPLDFHHSLRPAETPLYDMLRLFEIGRSHMALLMQLRPEAKERQRRQT